MIPLQGTFEYIAVIPDRAGTVFSCQTRSQRQFDGELENIRRLVGPSPLLRVEDAGPTPNPSVNNPAGERCRLRLTAADRRQASIAEASFILDRGVISALRPGDLLHMVRTGSGGIAISAIRSDQLIFAVGAITRVPLGSTFEASLPTDLIREAEAVFRRRESGFHLFEYPIEVKASGEQRIAYGGRFALGIFEVWILRGFQFGTPGVDECLSVAQKGACPVVDANSSALFLDSGGMEMVRWPDD